MEAKKVTRVKREESYSPGAAAQLSPGRARTLNEVLEKELA
jgi:hypothetical protein